MHLVTVIEFLISFDESKSPKHSMCKTCCWQELCVLVLVMTNNILVITVALVLKTLLKQFS